MTKVFVFATILAWLTMGIGQTDQASGQTLRSEELYIEAKAQVETVITEGVLRHKGKLKFWNESFKEGHFAPHQCEKGLSYVGKRRFEIGEYYHHIVKMELEDGVVVDVYQSSLVGLHWHVVCVSPLISLRKWGGAIARAIHVHHQRSQLYRERELQGVRIKTN